MHYQYDYDFQSELVDRTYFRNLLHIRDGAQVLCVSLSHLPMRWISWKRAANYASQNMVKWVIGTEMIEINSATRPYVVPTIVGIKGTENVAKHCRTIPITNANLFRRDGYLCMYCGTEFSHSKLTRDHIKPTCLGGRTTWTNLVCCCVTCNRKKSGAATPEAAGMKLIATPYEPNLVESLILSNRLILSDQLEFLKSRLNDNSRIKC